MGRFTYNHSEQLAIDDRTLRHLQVVIMEKLRRGEAFNFTWTHDPSMGSGQTSVWINPASRLRFKYDRAEPESLNRAWLAQLGSAADSPAGLVIVPEPPDDEPAG